MAKHLQINSDPHPLCPLQYKHTSALYEEPELPCVNMPSHTSANCLPCNFLEYVRGMWNEGWVQATWVYYLAGKLPPNAQSAYTWQKNVPTLFFNVNNL